MKKKESGLFALILYLEFCLFFSHQSFQAFYLLGSDFPFFWSLLVVNPREMEDVGLFMYASLLKIRHTCTHDVVCSEPCRLPCYTSTTLIASPDDKHLPVGQLIERVIQGYADFAYKYAKDVMRAYSFFLVSVVCSSSLLTTVLSVAAT